MSELDLIQNDIHAYLLLQEKKEMLRFLTAGSVDDGKSTLIGRLLWDSHGVHSDQMDTVRKESEKRGFTGGEIDYSLLVDGLLSEREQGITIDVAYRYFSTPKRKFIIADTPGHEQYTRNMATGASTADLAIILIDARLGVLAQTKRHSFIASLLGIKHLVVAVNKMDLMGYSQEVFDKIQKDYVAFAAKLEVSDIHFMPISALKGDNLVVRSKEMPWYDGPPLLSYLETVHIASDRNLIDLRFPVQYVNRPQPELSRLLRHAGLGHRAQGRRADGAAQRPQEPREEHRDVRGRGGRGVPAPVADDHAGGRGSTSAAATCSCGPTTSRTSRARSKRCWCGWRISRCPKGKTYWIKHTSSVTTCEVSDVRYKLDVNSLRSHDTDELKLNEIGRVALTASRPLFFDPYQRNKGTGAFVLVDRLTNATVAAGMILDRGPAELVSSTGERDAGAEVRLRKSQVPAEERAKRLAQTPFTLWLTGLPKSGKSEVAYALEKKLWTEGYTASVIDGENMRLSVSRDLGFSSEDRAENTRRAAEVAKMMNGLGMITIAGFISSYAAHRTRAREIVGAERFIEVYLSAPIDACEARDDEGLYARARTGELPYFTGITAPYEAPENPELVLPTHEIGIDAAVEKLYAYLRERGLVR
jgi:bifunctional enzyme CysN/CysC